MIYLNFIQMKIVKENRKTTFKMHLREIGTDTEDWYELGPPYRCLLQATNIVSFPVRPYYLSV